MLYIKHFTGQITNMLNYMFFQFANNLQDQTELDEIEHLLYRSVS